MISRRALSANLRKRWTENRSKNRFIIRLACVAVAVLVALFFVRTYKRLLIREGTEFIRGTLSEKMGLDFDADKVSGSLWGRIRFDKVRATDTQTLGLRKEIFRADRIEFSFRWLDFLSKKFDAKFEVIVERPQVHWRPHILLRRGNFPFMEWMKTWALSQRKFIHVEIKDLELTAEPIGLTLEGIQLTYENNRVEMEVPLRHLAVAGFDLTTTFKASGEYEAGFLGRSDTLVGQIRTEGTVINWTPAPDESSFEFELSDAQFTVLSSSFFGGFEMTGAIDLSDGCDLRGRITAVRYPLKKLNLLLGTTNAPLAGCLDMDLWAEGNLLSPSMRVRAHLTEGLIGKRSFQAMDINAAGVYPTMRIENSRLLMPDGGAMHFAEKTVEFKELFREKMYEGLVSGAAQDTVVWGDWEFKRPLKTGVDATPEVLVLRSLGESANLKVSEYQSKERLDGSVAQQAEVGFEYKLRDKNTVKIGLRDDEQYVGIEQKLSF